MKKNPLKSWLALHWSVIGAGAVVSFLLGYWGFSAYFAATGDLPPKLNILYLTLQLFTLESGSFTGRIPVMLEVARFMAPLVAATAFLKALMVIFRDQVQRLRIRFFRDHIVICGLGRKGNLLARNLRGRGDKVVVIERDEGNDLLEQCRDLGTVILTGDATDPELLNRARVRQAAFLVALCGDDGVNAEIAVHAHTLSKKRRGRALHGIVHLFDPQLCSLLQERELEGGVSDAFRLDFFNLFELGARSWLKENDPFAGRKNRPDSIPHLLIVGGGRLGESLIVQAARTWKERGAGTGEKLVVSLVDRVAGHIKDILSLRHPGLESYCRIIPVETDVKSPFFQGGDFLVHLNRTAKVSHIFVCLDNESLALSSALALNRHVRDEAVPIVVRMEHSTGLGSLLAEGEAGRQGYENLKAFGLLDHTCHPDLLLGGTHEILARAIHEVYLSQALGKHWLQEEKKTLAAWDELPPGIKESNRKQADHIGIKLWAVGCALVPLRNWDDEGFVFTAEEITKMAAMEHERWVKERLEDGWKHTSGRLDERRKRHPGLLPWEDLPDTSEDKRKSIEAVKRLPELLAAAGFGIRRLSGGASGRTVPGERGAKVTPGTRKPAPFR